MTVWEARHDARVLRGVRGDPLCLVTVFADRLELQRGWCFASGH